MRQIDAILFINGAFFARWMEQQVKKDFGGEGMPVLFNHPAVKKIVAMMTRKGKRGKNYCYKIGACAEMLAEDKKKHPQAIAAYMAILVKHAPNEVIKVMSADPLIIASNWLDARSVKKGHNIKGNTLPGSAAL